MIRSALARAGIGLTLALFACSDVTTNLVNDHGSGAGGASTPRDAGRSRDASTTRDAAASVPDAGNVSRVPEMCGDRLCHCDDGQDNDADGLVDGLDPECTGPFDDDETSFATGLPNKSNGKCRDCFWDDNAGSGDDGCSYASACLQGLSAQPGSCSCEVSQHCKDSCLDRTPNGCDCFGCCDVTRADGSVISVQLDDNCSLAKIGDAQACPLCKQSPDCHNPCGPCELCPGRTLKALPAACSGSQPADDHACDEGQPVCGTAAACPLDSYCQLGCCLYVVP